MSGITYSGALHRAPVTGRQTPWADIYPARRCLRRFPLPSPPTTIPSDSPPPICPRTRCPPSPVRHLHLRLTASHGEFMSFRASHLSVFTDAHLAGMYRPYPGHREECWRPHGHTVSTDCSCRLAGVCFSRRAPFTDTERRSTALPTAVIKIISSASFGREHGRKALV